MGVIGKEGQQAVNNSDYAIGRFKFIANLLLVHGRYNYIRIANLSCYMFFKNIMLTMAQFWFTTHSGFSGQKYYSELATQFYNTFYTAGLIIIYAVSDRDICYEWCLEFPKLYNAGRLKQYFNRKVFWSWMVYAFLASLIIYYFPQYGMIYFGGIQESNTIGIYTQTYTYIAEDI